MDITRALQRMVRRYPNGTAAVAAAMGLSETTLNHKVSPTYQTQFCSPEEMLLLSDITGDDDALNVFASARRKLLLDMPDIGAAGEQICTQRLLKAVSEFAEFASETAKSAQAGGVTDNARARVEKEAAEAMAAIQHVVAWVAAANLKDKPAQLRVA